MGNHNFSCDNSLFQWPFSIAMLNYRRVYHLLDLHSQSIGLFSGRNTCCSVGEIECLTVLSGFVYPAFSMTGLATVPMNGHVVDADSRRFESCPSSLHAILEDQSLTHLPWGAANWSVGIYLQIFGAAAMFCSRDLVFSGNHMQWHSGELLLGRRQTDTVGGLKDIMIHTIYTIWYIVIETSYGCTLGYCIITVHCTHS